MSERFDREVLEGEYKPITAWGYFGYEYLSLGLSVRL